MKVDYNPYEGREVTGVPAKVLLRGQVVVEDSEVHRKSGAREVYRPRARHRTNDLRRTPITELPCPRQSGTALADELISQSVNGDDELGMGGIRFYFLAQPGDVDVHRP